MVVRLIVLAVVFLALRLPWLGFPAGVLSDEHYYVPAAQAYVQGELDPDLSMPPLGKMLTAAGIALFGNDSFGWRLPSCIFSLAGVLLCYALARRLFEDEWVATISALLLCIDLMAISMSRIALQDAYMNSFMLAAVWAALRYSDTPDRLYPWGLLSALMAGLSLGCKLSGGAIVPVVFAMLMVRGVPWKQLLLLGCVFAAVMIAVHFILYIPLFMKGAPLTRLLYREVLYLHLQMGSQNFQVSEMWDWPLLRRPFWFYREPMDFTQPPVRAIMVMGNYVFWWGFLVLGLRTLWQAVRSVPHRIVCIGYLGFFLFWIVKPKGYTYYMLPCVPYMAMTVSDAVVQAVRKGWPGWLAVGAFSAFLLRTEVLFFPITQAIPMSPDWFRTMVGGDAGELALWVTAVSLAVVVTGWRPVKSSPTVPDTAA